MGRRRAGELTLQVEEGAAVGGGVGGRLRDGQQEGAVASQQDAHEAQEGFLDVGLQLLLPTVHLVEVGQQELQRGFLLARRANCEPNQRRKVMHHVCHADNLDFHC